MCLTQSNGNAVKAAYSKTRQGFKVMRKQDGRYVGPIFKKKRYQKNKWLTAGDKAYPFHLFFNLADAKRYASLRSNFDNDLVIMKVKFKDVAYYGYQGSLPAVCAQHMMLLSEVQ